MCGRDTAAWRWCAAPAAVADFDADLEEGVARVERVLVETFDVLCVCAGLRSSLLVACARRNLRCLSELLYGVCL